MNIGPAVCCVRVKSWNSVHVDLVFFLETYFTKICAILFQPNKKDSVWRTIYSEEVEENVY